MKDKLYSRIDEIGVVGPAWEKLREVLKEIVDTIPECEKKKIEEPKKGKK